MQILNVDSDAGVGSIAPSNTLVVVRGTYTNLADVEHDNDVFTISGGTGSKLVFEEFGSLYSFGTGMGLRLQAGMEVIVNAGSTISSELGPAVTVASSQVVISNFGRIHSAANSGIYFDAPAELVVSGILRNAVLADVARREYCRASPCFVGVAAVGQVSIADGFVVAEVQHGELYPADQRAHLVNLADQQISRACRSCLRREIGKAGVADGAFSRLTGQRDEFDLLVVRKAVLQGNAECLQPRVVFGGLVPDFA